MVFVEISQNSKENTCARVSFFSKVTGFFKKETLAQVALTGSTRQQVLQLMMTMLESKLAQTHVALTGPTRQQVLQNTSGGCPCY